MCQFVTAHASALFDASLAVLEWCSTDGVVHAIIHAVHCQLDRIPALLSDATRVRAFADAKLSASIDWTTIPELATLRARIGGKAVCISCGAADVHLSLCGQCKRKGVTYCSRACQAKDWARHKTVCPKK